MERVKVSQRPGWKERVEKLGMYFHTTEEAYWDESVCYRFSAGEIDTLEAATNELHRICLLAVERVLAENLFFRFRIPETFVPLIRNSWEREDLSLYGRFDLCYDGKSAPKMYEYNADTPTALLEAGVIQWHWLEDTFPKYDQFNSIHDKLIERWKESGVNGPVHFACMRDQGEDFATTVYMEDTAVQAGLKTKRLFMDEIGWNGRAFVDTDDLPIQHLFKLYPWEWLITEDFAPHLLTEPCRIVEPAWKMLLSNKAILPLLWEMFPDHPNLLPAAHWPEELGTADYVKKPVLGREGANITMVNNGGETMTAGDYGDGDFVYQALAVPKSFDGFHPVIGSWIVRDESAGIGIRESDALVTGNTSRFVPHFFVP